MLQALVAEQRASILEREAEGGTLAAKTFQREELLADAQNEIRDLQTANMELRESLSLSVETAWTDAQAEFRVLLAEREREAARLRRQESGLLGALTEREEEAAGLRAELVASLREGERLRGSQAEMRVALTEREEEAAGLRFGQVAQERELVRLCEREAELTASVEEKEGDIVALSGIVSCLQEDKGHWQEQARELAGDLHAKVLALREKAALLCAREEELRQLRSRRAEQRAALEREGRVQRLHERIEELSAIVEAPGGQNLLEGNPESVEMELLRTKADLRTLVEILRGQEEGVLANARDFIFPLWSRRVRQKQEEEKAEEGFLRKEVARIKHSRGLSFFGEPSQTPSMTPMSPSCRTPQRSSSLVDDSPQGFSTSGSGSTEGRTAQSPSGTREHESS